MKRLWRQLLCLMLIVCMLAGCSKDGDEEDKTPTKAPTATEAVTPTPTEGEKPQATPTTIPGVDAEVLLQEQQKFDDLLTEFFVEYIADNSINLHFTLQNPEKYGITLKTDMGEDASDPAQFGEECKEWRTRLSEITYDYLTKSQQINYDRLAYEFDLAIASMDLTVCYDGLLSVNNNAINSIATFMTEYPLLEEKDVLEYIATIKALPGYIDYVMDTIVANCKDGLCPTQYMMDSSVECAKGFAGEGEHPFVVAFSANIEEATDLSDAQKADYVEQVRGLVAELVVPAMKGYLTSLEEVQKYVTEATGLSKKDGGKEYYEYLVRTYTGSDMTVDEMFEYLKGKKETTMAKYMAIIMFNADIIDKYFEADYPYSAEEMLDQLKEKIKENYPAIEETEYILSFLPEPLQVDGVLAYFLTPQIDNPDRKVIRVNPSMTDSNVMLFSTLAHEGYPGHLYQDEYFTSLEGYHPVNALFSYLGYSEGWATMAGANAYEWCLGDANVAEMFNFDYNYSMLLASLTDIGVNYYGWSQDDVYDFLAENMIEDEEAAKEFYEMVISDPGIYLPYMFGYYYCTDIIDTLMKEKDMTEKEAYEAFLNVGPCSFDVLEKHLGISVK